MAKADSGNPEGLQEWCEYVLKGLRDEIKKVDRLLDLAYMVTKILSPVLHFALERKLITKREHDILEAVVISKDMTIKSAGIQKIIGETSSVQRSRIIGGLKKKGMLFPLKKEGRVYTIGFANNYLLRGIMKVLEDEGFIPESLNKN